MKKVIFKVILSIVICSMIITLFVSGAAISKTREILHKEVEKEISYAVQKYAVQFSKQLETHENVIDLVSLFTEETFLVSQYENNRMSFEEKERLLATIIKRTMESQEEIKSLYFTFNPDTSKANDEVWYLRNGSGDVQYREADNTIEDWLVDGKEDSEYYFSAIRKGSNWSGVEYDRYLNDYSLTYSRACYDKNGNLIGVAGTDIFTDDIFDSVRNMELLEGGSAFLMDGEYNYLVGSKPEELFLDLKKSGGIKLVQPEIDSSNKNITYAIIDGERYLTSYGKISNGWNLAIIQSEKSLMEPVEQIKQMVYVMGLLVLVAVFLYFFYLSRKSVLPIVREYEQKDIILLHQSRQAKLGEMVGNIAHQWKQPLNVMNITLSNLKDDYNSGFLSEELMDRYLADMRSYIISMSGTVDDFADFLKPGRKKEAFDPCSAVETSLGLMAESLRMNRIAVRFERAEGLCIFGFRNEFCQGIFNILNNARDAIVEASMDIREIAIKMKRVQDGDRDIVVIEIANRGPNIPENLIPLLFQPYFTTKEQDGGTGIGLYLTRQIIEMHFNGRIEMFNTIDGVCCRITIPGGSENE